MDIGKTGSNVDSMHDSGSDLQDIGLEDQGRVVASQSSGEHSGHDQLPNVEEYKTSQQVGTSSRASLKMTLAIALMIVVASILIAVGVVIGRDTPRSASSQPETPYLPDSPEPVPVAPMSGRVYDVTTFLTNMGWADSAAINTPDTPQWKAAQWLANTDPRKMEVSVEEEFMNRYALATIYFAMGGQDWHYDLNWLTKDSVCQWNSYFQTKAKVQVQIGVACHSGISVQELFLPNTGLTGALPPEIGLMLDLQDLNLFGNSISGALPESMKNLLLIETLVLHDNQFNGPFPPWISRFTRLNTLNLAENKFYGPLPPDMGNSLAELQTLVLEHNFFTGTLDPLEGLTTITALYLGNNEFAGDLRDEIFNSWFQIEVMDISDNMLSGPLPAMLIAKDNLLVVDLHGNNFSGRLPSIVEVDDSIEFLALHDNQLTGPIDKRLNSLTKLAHLDLSKNFFTGDMPTSLGSMKSLTYLYLAFNDQFNPGPIPVEYATLPNLVDLSLQKTQRTGKIPYVFEALTKLVLLDLNSNKLTGEIPPEIGGMTKLKFLLLKENGISGSLPATFQNLQQLDTFLLDDTLVNGGSDNACTPKLPLLTTFIADCTALGHCFCCTECCAASNTTCNTLTWFSDVDPVAEGGYVRNSYLFNEKDIVYPVAKQSAGYYQNYTGYYESPP